MTIFAFTDVGVLSFLFMLALAIPAIIKGLAQPAKAREEAEVKKQNPEMWLRMKEIEQEQRRMDHDNRMARHESGRHAAEVMS